MIGHHAFTSPYEWSPKDHIVTVILLDYNKIQHNSYLKWFHAYIHQQLDHS